MIRGLPRDPELISISIAEAGDWVPAGPLEVSSYDAPVTFVLKK